MNKTDPLNNIKRKNKYLYTIFFLALTLFSILVIFIFILNRLANDLSIFNLNSYSLGAKATIILSLFYFALGWIGTSIMGLIQIIIEKDHKIKYVGWLNLFFPEFIFPIFVNYTIWRRSGLTKMQRSRAIKNFNIQNVNKIFNFLKDNHKLDHETIDIFDRLNLLVKQSLLTNYEVKSRIYKLLLSKFALSELPIFYSAKDILELEVLK